VKFLEFSSLDNQETLKSMKIGAPCIWFLIWLSFALFHSQHGNEIAVEMWINEMQRILRF
jgi:hypothetical protein